MKCEYTGCKRKILVPHEIICKCGMVLCAKHRLPFDHECDFDWKNEHKQRIQDNNPVIRKEKIDKI